MSLPVNSVSQASSSPMDILHAACDHVRNSTEQKGNQSHPIEDSVSPDVKSAAAILVGMRDDTFAKEEREKLAKEEHDKLVLAARWYTLFQESQPCFHAPRIQENPPAPGVAAMAAILAVSDPPDEHNIWKQPTQEVLEEEALKYWGDLSVVGTFDKTAALDTLAHAMLQKRPITRTELILLECDYIRKHRAWAVSMNFEFGPLYRTFRRRCGTKNVKCICSYIEHNYMYD